MFCFLITGQLDKDTVDTMQLPRCGVKDKVGSGSDSRSKRYALQGKKTIIIFLIVLYR